MASPTINTRFTPEELAKIDAAAARKGWTRSKVLHWLVGRLDPPGPLPEPEKVVGPPARDEGDGYFVESSASDPGALAIDRAAKSARPAAPMCLHPLFVREHGKCKACGAEGLK